MVLTIKAGELNKRVTIQSKTVEVTDSIYKGETWSDTETRWAKMITTGGREFYTAQKVNEETTAVFQMRYTTLITTDMRLKLENRIFEILPPINDVDGEHLELLISTREVISSDKIVI